jgi:nitroimidazol reductase NimA-like FMN-containing flavoprotein (pyridoxamine 5'-phosphate oxidase superfamily)
MSSNRTETVEWDARAAAVELLREHRVAVIATAVQDEPWASTVYYASDGFTLYVNTPDGTTMLRNLLANRRFALAVDEQRPTFFVQATGEAAVVDDPAEMARARDLLAVRVPEAHVGRPGYTLLKLCCEAVYVSDFRQGYRPRAQVKVS